MSEFALNASETRPSRQPKLRKSLPPVAIAAVGAVALAGFAMAASSVIGGIVVPPKAIPAKVAAPVIDGGLASKWPDLKDGLPVVAGGSPMQRADAAPAPVPATVEPVKVATLSAVPGAMPKPAKSPAPIEAKAPTARIPVPTPVAVAPAPATVKPVLPTRSAALVPPPREAVRAREDASPTPIATARLKPETPKPVADAAKPKVEATKVREAAATDKRAAARPATASATPDKPQKVAAAPKPAPAHSQEAVKTTVASAEPEETNILGVKLPSLAPAGRKIQESVSALGDAVRNAF